MQKYGEKKLNQGDRCPFDFHLKKLLPHLEPRLAQRTASTVCSADQLHPESVGMCRNMMLQTFKLMTSFFCPIDCKSIRPLPVQSFYEYRCSFIEKKFDCYLVHIFKQMELNLVLKTLT